MDRAVRIVVASDKFKGSLPAAGVAAALARGIQRVLPSASVVAVPVADGGDGTLAAAAAAGFALVPVTVTGPTGEPVRSAYARKGADRDRGAGRRLGAGPAAERVRGTDRRHPRHRRAGRRRRVDAGCTDVVLGLGGSCSTDGGAGLAVALGARVLDGSGAPLAPGGAALAGAASLDLSEVSARLSGVRVVVATDVDNPLTGPSGAARRLRPAEGRLGRATSAILDAALTHWADLVSATTGRDLRDVPGAGAAGGAGSARWPCWGPRSAPGSRRCWTWSASTRPLPAPTWWSPARARWTPRACGARPRWACSSRPGASAYPWSRSVAARCCRPSSCPRPACSAPGPWPTSSPTPRSRSETPPTPRARR